MLGFVSTSAAIDSSDSAPDGEVAVPARVHAGFCGCSECQGVRDAMLARPGAAGAGSETPLVDPSPTFLAAANPASGFTSSQLSKINTVLAANLHPGYGSGINGPYDWGARWNYQSPLGTGVNLTYSFLSSVPGYYSSSSEFRSGFQGLSSTHRTAVRNVLSMISTFCKHQLHRSRRYRTDHLWQLPPDVVDRWPDRRVPAQHDEFLLRRRRRLVQPLLEQLLLLLERAA